MEKDKSSRRARSGHKPIDPGRMASRERRTPGKPYEPRRAVNDSGRRQNRSDREKR